MNRIYAGVGSRDTPPDICAFMTEFAQAMFRRGFVLHSGGATGADTAFENGAGNRKRIFIPKPGFQNRYPGDGIHFLPLDDAFDIAERFHPAWDKCWDDARRLHARNAHQVLGIDLKSPVRFVACWTVNGKATGGTATAINIAKAYGVPVLNFHSKVDRAKAEKIMEVVT